MFSFKRKIGNKAEKIAYTFLCKQGLKLITKNFLTKLGEIDIIMLDKKQNIIVFVEVRYRANNNFGSAVDTVSANKQRKIINTAQLFLYQNKKYQDFICRFDVIGIESDLKYPTIDWIQDAFE